MKELSGKRYVSAYNIGVLYAGLGERDEAFRWLQKVEDDRSEWFALINVDPRLDGLHGDPRFTRILRQVGLVQGVREKKQIGPRMNTDEHGAA